jgi:16S rRNA (cytosine967-C5)-methyltransferase
VTGTGDNGPRDAKGSVAPRRGKAGAPSGSVSPARLAAWRALVRLRGAGGHFDDSVAALPELQGLGPRDRALANELIIGTIKRRGSVDAVLGAFTKAPLAQTSEAVLEALRIAAFQILFLDRVPVYAVVDDAVRLVARKDAHAKGFANAVLRKVADDGADVFATLSEGDGMHASSVRHSCPVWMVRLLRRDLGDEAAERFLVAANAAPERCLRVNTLKGSLAAAREALAAAGTRTRGIPGLPQALVYDGPSLQRSAPFREGLVTPQSRGSQIAGMVAATGARGGVAVLDLCAAPGTKTAQLAALLGGSAITAVDLDELRLDALRTNLGRLGVEGVKALAADALELPPSTAGAYDAVLLDAPCSGLGTLGSRADLRWRRRASDIPRLADLQRRLLLSAARTVRPGGALTYAVCTVTRAETLGALEPLLATGEWASDDLGAEWPGLAHPDAGGCLLILPPDGGSSGFFVARFRRIAGS